jgi:hypothetical protein
MGLLRVLVPAVLAGVGGCEGYEDPVDAPPPSPRTVSLSWKVMDLNNVEISCAQIDAPFVTVGFFKVQTGAGFTEVFDCFRKGGTKLLDDGEYMITFEVADRLGTLMTLPAKRYRIAGDTAIDEATFAIDPVGTLVFTLDTGQAANCGAGSQLTGMTIELLHLDNSCEMATLAIEPSTSYPVNCVSPGVTSCIEKDKRVTATRIPAGEYRIRVVGLQGSMPCWLHDQRQRVRAAGLSRTATLPLTRTCP